MLQKTIMDTITVYEPRAKQIQVIIDPNIDENNIAISIIFSMQNLTQPINFSILLPRVR